MVRCFLATQPSVVAPSNSHIFVYEGVGLGVAVGVLLGVADGVRVGAFDGVGVAVGTERMENLSKEEVEVAIRAIKKIAANLEMAFGSDD